jgi:hypothetical protein
MQIKDKIIFNQQTKTATIMRDGIYHYLAKEVGDTERDPMDVVRVFRPKKAVEDAFNRFVEMERIPLTIEHPKNFVNVEDEAAYKDGTATNPVTKVVGQYNTLGCKIGLNDEAMKLYDKGIKELSCGWEGRFEKVEDQDYDYVQHFVDFNHIAILPDGRGGSLCAITDNNLKILEMPKTEKDLDLKDLKSEIVDTIRTVIDECNEEKKKTKDEDSKEDLDKKETEDEESKEDEKDEDKKKKTEDEDKEDEKKETKDADIVDAASIRKSLIQDFSSIFAAVEKGVIAVKDCVGKSPEEIKQAVVKSLVKKDIAITDSAMLDVHYSVALENYSHPSWKKSDKINDAESKPLEKAINDINFLKNK